MEDEILAQRSRLSWACEKTAAVLIILLGPFVGLIGGACLPLIWIYFRVKLVVQYLRSRSPIQEKDSILKMV
ncbi:uncharacterized protein PV07_08602 [Cladophialophora immunda]|uniref:Uncharacterized protein n=1 Tax=Cladophialophora immunda TaxID=569365 RepID=A0A0D2CPD5_9EURO|nr:uncharacterized protein PV07_08602 [Cladophialophora immunda]KIW25429.1 hypothetical protein PV07_08602 [Cladophialophora immunda]